MARKTKNSAAARRQYDKSALYGPEDAMALVKSTSFAKFDESVDAVFSLGIDARKADQLVRGTVSLPHGTGKDVRVIAFVGGEKIAEAEEAGADIVGGKELAEEISGGRALDFDVAVASPDMMPHVGKLVKEFKAGRVEYRNDRYGNVHIPIGKVSFDSEQLTANFAVVADEIIRARPAAAKGRFVRKVAISSTMGPGIHIDPSQVEDLVKRRR
jgi:large subunit ribosomal protein L1